jgi:hypothetical protein
MWTRLRMARRWRSFWFCRRRRGVDLPAEPRDLRGQCVKHGAEGGGEAVAFLLRGLQGGGVSDPPQFGADALADGSVGAWRMAFCARAEARDVVLWARLCSSTLGARYGL